MECERRILIVDDEKDIRDAVMFILNKEGFIADKAANGMEAIEKVEAGESYDLIIMDIIMPYMSGTETAKRLRNYTECPILFLTAKSTEQDKIEAYESGGDDYLSKPFSSVELVLRIRAILKRCNKHGGQDAISIDLKYRRVMKNNVLVQLTDKEFELLAFLYEHRGQAFPNSLLYEEVWNAPVIRVAEKYGVSDVAIHKVCKSMSIPTPPNGYWTKLKFGKEVKKEPLPPVLNGQSIKYGIKPIDKESIICAAKETGGIVTVEDHSIVGGLGSAVCEVVAENISAKVIRMGLQDVFGRSGDPEGLYKMFGLTPEKIAETVNIL
jgi:DNA-binding response OmpR family regulator